MWNIPKYQLNVLLLEDTHSRGSCMTDLSPWRKQNLLPFSADSKESMWHFLACILPWWVSLLTRHLPTIFIDLLITSGQACMKKGFYIKTADVSAGMNVDGWAQDEMKPRCSCKQQWITVSHALTCWTTLVDMWVHFFTLSLPTWWKGT